MEKNLKSKENRSFLCEVQARNDNQHGSIIEGIPIISSQNPRSVF